MEYSKKESVLVGIAMGEASAQVNMAYYQLGEFYDHYFMQTKSKETLIFDLENRLESVEYLMRSILESIRRAKIELDVFCNPDSNIISAFMLNVNEKQDILATLHSDSKQVNAP
ncbi:MAG: hypothetical protein IKB51_07335 [Clostridia bacterium]|nr:hypothetical protein [Clostridia bacterium]